ncbi:AbrB family transcriptional regulator [Flexibacterium corallicola]|uniref:AbrB family transcriptional regulator n=1 Tax=Flexibacterium corallicola TaxID=3037259 RepID=UPI00286F552D|nr:AbrB family transcriptional regulator [Pseudovibrio sp. M1P-2-3]
MKLAAVDQLKESQLSQTLFAIIIGSLGALVFTMLQLPAAALSGPVLALAIAGAVKVPLAFPDRLRDICLFGIGIAMGQAVTPDTLDRIGSWPVTIGLIPIVVGVITLASFSFLFFVCRWARDLSYFASIPGALGFVVAVAEERQANLAPIMTVQLLRLIILVLFVPSLLSSVQDISGHEVAIRELSTPFELGIIATLCLLGANFAHKISLPAPLLTGAFFVSSILAGSGVVTVVLPQWLTLPFYVGLGTLVGTRFAGIPLGDLRRWSVVALGSFLAGILASSAIAFAVSQALEIPFGQLLLAYAPGGMEVMALMAFILDFDPAFVATHQLVRYMGMVVLLPFVTNFLLGKKT